MHDKNDLQKEPKKPFSKEARLIRVSRTDDEAKTDGPRPTRDARGLRPASPPTTGRDGTTRTALRSYDPEETTLRADSDSRNSELLSRTALAPGQGTKLTLEPLSFDLNSPQQIKPVRITH